MAHARELKWLERSVGVLSLSDRAIISVSGDDAREWLQGQLTNQLEGVEPGGSLYAFVLTLKGRILADVYALVREVDVWLDVPTAQVGALLERLDRYIIMEDVDLEARNDLHVIAAQGPSADEVAEGGWPADRPGGRMRGSGEPVAVTPGRYKITGWPGSRGYEEKIVDIEAGKNVMVILRATE